MKKLFSLFCMIVLLSSNGLSAFTYAYSQVEEESKTILKEKIYETEQQIFKTDIQSSIAYTVNNTIENLDIYSNLNKEEITGKEYYNNVITEVIAPVGSFQEGTILSIVPIRTKKELKEIKEQLVEQQEEITEESDVVAFDISFLYSGEEVQPVTGKTVQVTFNYGNHKALTKADEDKGQELKVYHLNDKDEDGNKVENISDVRVEEVEITKNKEGELMVDAESFSIYTIVTQVHEEGIYSGNQLSNFVYGEISIPRPDSLSGDNNLLEGITIMDRNLGAIMTGEGENADSKSYGYYYQWGNNYGFDPFLPASEINISEQQVDISGMTGYYSSTFISGHESWMTGSLDEIFGLWGGELDSVENGWGVTGGIVINLNKRQGPCPNGWHVPSLGEWSTLVRYWGVENGVELRNYKNYQNGYVYYGLYDFGYDGNKAALFYKVFNIPRNTSGRFYKGGNIWQNFRDYRSSSPYYGDSSESAGLYYMSYADSNGTSRGNAIPVRCFKNIYSGTGNLFKITFNFNGGTGSTAEIAVASGSVAVKPAENPQRGDKIFMGWYVSGVDTEYKFNEPVINNIELYAKWGCESGFTISEDLNSCNPNIGTLISNDGKGNETSISRYVANNTFINNGYEFIGWNTQSDGNGIEYKSGDVINESGLVLYAQWKSLEEKAEETITENVVYTNTTTVTVGDETTEEVLSGSSTLTLKTKEVESHEVTTEEDTTKVQDSEIKVTSDKTVEYEGGLEVYLEKTENAETEKLTGTIKFSAPVAVKIPISSDAEYVKVQVKHGDEDFGFKGLTLNPVNECNNGEAVYDKYNGEDVLVTGNTNKYATIYTCSASTFVAYTESLKPVVPQPSAGGGRTIKQESNIATEQEHNSADTVDPEATQTSKESTVTPTIDEQVKKIEGRALTRGEVAIMTNMLLEVYPQLVEGKQELDDVTNACSNYADEQNFTKDEKKAITRLCKLSIMGIHNDTNEPLEEFLVNNKTTNDEFSKVINRSVSTYNEKDLSTIKDALKKLEGDEENVVFGTVYDMFMGIKNILS